MGLVLSLVLMAGDFSLLETVDGVRVETREVEGSKFVELRFSTRSKAPLHALCEAAFGDGKVTPAEPFIVAREVLRETSTERVTYERVEAPMISKRDYAVRRRKIVHEESCEVAFEAANELAPAQTAGWVRLAKLRGTWRFVRRGDAIEVEYVSFSEPGGDMPAFISEGPRRSAELNAVKQVLKRASK